MSIDSKTRIFGMPLFSIGQSAYGFIAIGQMSRGVFCLGQLSLGVVTVSQLGLGVVTFNQVGAGIIDFSANAGIGLFTFALAGIGIIFAYGLAVFGLISNHYGIYKLDPWDKTGELVSFDNKFSFLLRQMNTNPLPWIIWLLICTAVSYAGYILYKKFRKKAKKEE